MPEYDLHYRFIVSRRIGRVQAETADDALKIGLRLVDKYLVPADFLDNFNLYAEPVDKGSLETGSARAGVRALPRNHF